VSQICDPCMIKILVITTTHFFRNLCHCRVFLFHLVSHDLQSSTKPAPHKLLIKLQCFWSLPAICAANPLAAEWKEPFSNSVHAMLSYS